MKNKLKELKEAKELVLNNFDILISEEEQSEFFKVLNGLNKLIILEKKEEMKKYLFYYEFKNGGKQYEVEIKLCKRPKKTKVYKQLEESFNDGFIEVYGYEQI